MVDEDDELGDRAHPIGWAGCGGAGHGHEGVGGALVVGAGQIGDTEVALAECFGGLGPVGFELGGAVVGPDLVELGAADVVETGA